MKNRMKKELAEFRILLRAVPSVTLALFVISVFSMNLFANKSINTPFDWLALDCGIIFSWFAFLSMDVITKHFGPKGATEISVFAMLVNLALCFMFYVGSIIPGVWGESFVDGSEGVINSALDGTFGGTWYVLLGSAFAFTVSAFVNNFSNYAVGKAFRKNPDGATAYIARTYISTALGQFCDNMVFALTVSHVFFGWTLLQCVTCAITGMIAELICEVLFSFFGFRLCKRWKEEGVGREYLTAKGSK